LLNEVKVAGLPCATQTSRLLNQGEHTMAILQPEPCPPLTELQKMIDEFQNKSKQQELEDAKPKLAELTKINAEVEQAKAKYKQDYEGLKFAIGQFKEYQTMREKQIATKVSEPERKIVDGIVDCADRQISYLEKQWIDTRNSISNRQAAFNKAQAELSEIESTYKKFLDYKATHKELESLEAQSTKNIEAQDFHSAYFLVSGEMGPRLKDPPAPEAFNTALQKLAKDYFKAVDAARMAKTDLDQANATLQKAKKDYEDAKTKRRDNVLSQIAAASFEASPDKPPGSGSSGAGSSG
jgi:hypothetical protein